MTTDSSYDVVIVGSGVAGSLLAYKLGTAGARVCIIEAGPVGGDRRAALDRFYAAASKTPDSPWPKSSQAPASAVLDTVFQDWRDDQKYYLGQKGRLPFQAMYERIGGGTTNHWNGIALRHVPNDFELQKQYGVEGSFNWPIGYQELEKWYGAAETELGVAGDHDAENGFLGAWRSKPFPMPAVPSSYLDQYVDKRLKSVAREGGPLAVRNTPQARNSRMYDDRPACMGNSSCVPICPIQAKYDATVHLSKALALPNVTIKDRSVAFRINVDGSTEMISSISLRGWDGSEATVSAKAFAICAHAIETPKLLLMSPWKTVSGRTVSVANRSDQVGRNLMDHICVVKWGLSKEPVFPFRGPLSTSAVESFRDGDFRREYAAFIIEVGNDGGSWPAAAPFTTAWEFIVEKGLWGRRLREAMQDHMTRQLRINAEIECLADPNNRISLSSSRVDALGLPKPVVEFDLPQYTKKGFVQADKALDEIFSSVGVRDGYTELNAADTQSPFYFEVDGKGYQYKGAGHIVGTVRMGDDAGTSVVDSECRSHDHKNLFVVGSAVFPSSGTANPTLTIAALALRTVDRILATAK